MACRCGRCRELSCSGIGTCPQEYCGGSICGRSAKCCPLPDFTRICISVTSNQSATQRCGYSAHARTPLHTLGARVQMSAVLQRTVFRSSSPCLDAPFEQTHCHSSRTIVNLCDAAPGQDNALSWQGFPDCLISLAVQEGASGGQKVEVRRRQIWPHRRRICRQPRLDVPLARDVPWRAVWACVLSVFGACVGTWLLFQDFQTAYGPRCYSHATPRLCSDGVSLCMSCQIASTSQQVRGSILREPINYLCLHIRSAVYEMREGRQ